MLVDKCREQFVDGEDKEIRAEINRAFDASPTLRNKKDLIEEFVEGVSVDGALDEEWQVFIAKRREGELTELIEQENLRADTVHAFIEAAFRDGQLQTGGTAIARVLPPVSRFAAAGVTVRRSGG